MLSTRWNLNKKLKTTLLTHPHRKTFRLIPLWTPVNSCETLPLKRFFIFVIFFIPEAMYASEHLMDMNIKGSASQEIREINSVINQEVFL
jgi:hypothetical protein